MMHNIIFTVQYRQQGTIKNVTYSYFVCLSVRMMRGIRPISSSNYNLDRTAIDVIIQGIFIFNPL